MSLRTTARWTAIPFFSPSPSTTVLRHRVESFVLANEIKQRAGHVEIDCQSVKAMLDAGDDFVFLDCREQSEYDTVKIEGASLLPMSEIQTRVSEIEEHKKSKVVIHCHHGGRSLNVAMWLKGQGFENPLSMAGGIDVWAQEIDPTLPRY